MHDPEPYEARGWSHPVQRMGEIGDIVGAVFHLEPASVVTGEILHVDGGQSAGHQPRIRLNRARIKMKGREE